MAARRSSFEWMLEILCVLVLLAIFGTLVTHWAELPARVPLHFGASGEANRWGGKNGLLLLPFTALGIYFVLTLASRYQGLINLPISVNRDSPEVRSLLRQMTIVLKLVMLLVFFYLLRGSVNTALGRSNGLGRQVLPLILSATVVPLIYYLLKLRRYSQ